jgi:hypothetical protein
MLYGNNEPGASLNTDLMTVLPCRGLQMATFLRILPRPKLLLYVFSLL